jgi:hypothetical protein
MEKLYPKMWETFIIFKKSAQSKKNHPMCENSPNLVTLAVTKKAERMICDISVCQQTTKRPLCLPLRPLWLTT